MVNIKQLLFVAIGIIFVICAGCNKSSVPVDREVNKVIVESNDTNIADSNPDHTELIKQLEDANLPLQPNAYKVKQEFMKGKTVEQLIEDLGEIWSASLSTSIGGIAPRWNDISALAAYLPANPRVIRIIEEGRRNPDKVGSLVAANLEERIKRLPEVWLRYCEDTADDDDHSLGYLVGNDGTVIGSESYKQWQEDCYSIHAAMWILNNIDYDKGINSILSFGLLLENPNRHFTSPKMPGWNMDMCQHLCPEMAIYVVDSFLKDNQDPSYNKEREAFSAILGDLNLSGGTKRVKGSNALYPTDHMAEKVIGIDMSSEPWIDVEVPDSYALKRTLNESDKTSLIKVLTQAAKIHSKK